MIFLKLNFTTICRGKKKTNPLVLKKISEMTIDIQKGTQKKTITQFSWDLMGENKNGWEIVKESSQAVTNEIEKPLPPTGQASEKPLDNSKVENEVSEIKTEAVTNEVLEETNTNVQETQNNAAESISDPSTFISFCTENLKRNNVKDFLDIKQVKYQQNITNEKLFALLGETLNYNIGVLKTEFGV